MTQPQIIEVVRELRALERLLVAVQAQAMTPGASDAWRYAVVALDDRIRWCRYGLSLESPLAVGMAEELLMAEGATGELRPNVGQNSTLTTEGALRSNVERKAPLTADTTPGRIH